MSINITPSSIISTEALNNSKFTPSSFASFISAFVAVISSKPFLYTTVTLLAPWFFAVLAASIATFPAPIITTLSPSLYEFGDFK